MPAAISWRTRFTRSCRIGALSFLRFATVFGWDFHFLRVRETGPLMVDGPCLNMIHVLSLGSLRKDGSEFPRRYYNLWHRNANPIAGLSRRDNLAICRWVSGCLRRASSEALLFERSTPELYHIYRHKD